MITTAQEIKVGDSVKFTSVSYSSEEGVDNSLAGMIGQIVRRYNGFDEMGYNVLVSCDARETARRIARVNNMTIKAMLKFFAEQDMLDGARVLLPAGTGIDGILEAEIVLF